MQIQEKNLTNWLNEKIICSTEQFFQEICHEIEQARESITIESYIFDQSNIASKILNLCEQAVTRGVSVRILVDGIGSPNWTNQYMQHLDKKGIQSRVFHPVPWPLSTTFWILIKRTGKFGIFLSYINRRNHRKVYLFDQKIAFVGSINISSMHQQWKDTCARVEGRNIAELIYAFEYTWKHSYGTNNQVFLEHINKQKQNKKISRLVKLNYPRQRRRRNYKELIERFSVAKHRIWITNAYFIPPPRILKALSTAANKGIDVCILLPGKSDIFFTRWVSEILIEGLLHASVKVYEYLPNILHAKTIIIDNWVVVGSSNMNHRSFLYDLEADVVLAQTESVETLSLQFKNDIKNSLELNLVALKNRPFWERIGGRLALILKKWL